jgi:hypothetical protein
MSADEPALNNENRNDVPQPAKKKDAMKILP